MTLVTPSSADVMRGIADEIRRDPSIWTQGDFWKDANGAPCPPDLAVCACAMGLLEMAFGWGNDRSKSGYALHAVIGPDTVAHWNDAAGRTPGEVADAFDAAADILDAMDNAIEWLNVNPVPLPEGGDTETQS